ncbi:head-to-tail attachment protein [Acinetobacter phage vB_AbaP_Alexa]|nr:head-to-tail attachment protein [Acinetobacter phage vB_AbaP_Alexa]
MPKPSWENLDVFFQTDTVGGFGDVATFELADGSVRQITGIFDNPYLNAQTGEYEIDDMQPRFTCPETAAKGIKQYDYMVLDGKRYNVMGYPKSDGVGVVIIPLEISE